MNTPHEPTVYTLAYREAIEPSDDARVRQGSCAGGTRTVIVAGTVCATRDEAERLRIDRAANGDAFPGEFATKVPARLFAPAAPACRYSRFEL